MRASRFCALFQSFTVFSLVSFLGFAASAFAQDVLTYHNNNARTGLNAKETILTTSNVNSATFGLLFNLPVDGKVDAQPLYMSAVPIATRGSINLLIVATEHGSVYAFNADTGAAIWHMTTLKTGETTSDDRGCDQVTPEIGITATPVINRPVGANGVIYVVAMSKDHAGAYHQRLHALDPTNGKEVNGAPIDITAKFPGKGDNSSGGYVIFDPGQYKERASLLLLSGTVYLAWSSHCDIRPYTGWIMGYNATTLAQTSVLNLTPNGSDGAIWGPGAGLTSDSSGNLYVLDGNGVFDTAMNTAGFPKSGDFGNGFLKITTQGGLKVADYFEMNNQLQENEADTDLGSGGALILPPMKDSTGTTRNLVVGAGKDTNLYLANRDSMGKFSPSSNKVYQQLSAALPNGMWAMPAFVGGKLFYGPAGQSLLGFQFKSAKLVATPFAKTVNTFNYPGVTPSISSNVALNAIVWASENTDPAVLHAYDARNLLELYNSNQAADDRDHFGTGNKFITPTISHGKVYVGTTNGVGVFGLLSSSAAIAAKTDNAPAGN